MAHNIEGFKEHVEYIETKPIYFKYNGKITIKNEVKIIAETEKAILVREKIQDDLMGSKMYSTEPFWIAKSKITKRVIMETFTCEFCGSSYYTNVRFKVSGKVYKDEYNGYNCPDCIACLFKQDPEEISKLTIIRCP